MCTGCGQVRQLNSLSLSCFCDRAMNWSHCYSASHPELTTECPLCLIKLYHFFNYLFPQHSSISTCLTLAQKAIGPETVAFGQERSRRPSSFCIWNIGSVYPPVKNNKFRSMPCGGFDYIDYICGISFLFYKCILWAL